jgi:hypothetical protein
MKSSHISAAQTDALNNIITLMRSVGLKPADIAKAYKRSESLDESQSPARSELFLKLFSYIGGALIFAGLGVFISMQWDSLSSFPRVLITLGSGFVAFVMGVIFSNDPRYSKAALPAFIFAFLLQPTGLFVLLNEYFDGDNVALGSMIVFGPLALQQFLTFYKFRTPALAVFALLYFIGFAGAFTEFNDINRGLASLLMGTFLFFITTAMQDREGQKEFTWIFYIISVLLFFGGLYYFIGRTVFDPIGLSFSIALLLFATLRDSRTLYVLACLMVACYFVGGPGGGWRAWDSSHAELTALFTGLSLCMTGLWLRKTENISFFPLWIFLGAGFSFAGLYNFLEGMRIEYLFFMAPAIGIYAALALRTRALLAVSVICLVAFIADYSATHFANTIGWPILLILLGALTLGSGFLFARLSKQIKTANATAIPS